MNSKVRNKEKLTIILLLAFVVYLAYTQIPKKELQKQTPKKIEKKVEKKKEIVVPKKTTEKKPKKKIQKKTDKKIEFKKVFVPIITKVYNNLYKNFEKTKNLVETNPEDEKLLKLKEKYKVNTNEELLIILKPHPISIALSQAAIESAWGTSRFLKEANNIFGVWSFNKNEPRIAAIGKREDTTIYLKKFSSIEAAIKQYYKMLSVSKVYFEFKKENFYNDDPIEIAKKLTRYSEQGEVYTEKIISVLKYNNFKEYDNIR